ncbi:MAG: MBL fold metallo-hydrolase, partial [Chloroflexi bacterium]|nr:MBL fold metallo-hydrolase [Chloroflexota bacterium]
MAAHELYLLPNGVLSLPRSRVIYGELSDERLLTPVYSVLVRTDDGDVLYDTGIDPDAAYDPKALEGITRNLHSFSEEDDVRSRLRDAGTTEEAVGTVIMSHFHYDHVGGLRYFKNSKVYVQNNEYR